MASPEKFEGERDKRKEAKKKAKKERKQNLALNNSSEGRWRRIGSFAAWVGYTVNIEGEQEVVPVRRNTSRMELATVANNLKRYVRKKHELDAERKKKERQRRLLIRRGINKATPKK